MNSNGLTYLNFEPGNGTRYEVYAAPCPEGSPCNGSWLVSFPEIGTTYFFRPGSYIAHSYLTEKMQFDRRGNLISEADLMQMANAICKAVPGCTC